MTTLVMASVAATMTAAVHQVSFTVDNKSKTQVESFPVVLDLKELGMPFNATRAVVTVDGKEIPSQLDDLNRDGINDELATVVTIDGKGKKTVTVKLDDEGEMPSYPAGTNAYIKMRDEKKKYPKIVTISYPGDADTRTMYNSIYGHGAVLENPYNAIRVYMDNRQSIDLYGKNKPGLELETTGFYTTREQMDQGFGRDILWAGKSVGAGSFRGFTAGNPATIDTVAVRTQTLLASGPVRSIVEVIDNGWIHNGRRHDMTQRYTMWSGRRDVDVDVKITNAAPDELFCVGIQKLETDNKGFIEPSKPLSGSWGSNVPEKKYPELTELVGLGLTVNPANLVRTVEDDVNYLTLVKVDRDGEIHYKVVFAAGRENDGFKDAGQWFDYLNRWQEQMPWTGKVKVGPVK